MEEKFNIVLERLKVAKLDENILCSEFWKKLLELHQNFDEQACWALFVDNIEWLVNTGMLTGDDIRAWFSESDLNAHGIYTKGSHEIKDSLAIGFGEVKLEASGHSRIVLFERAFCEAYDTTFVSGFQDSSFVVNDCLGQCFHRCRATAKGFSKVEAWDKAFVKAENYSYVIGHDRAVVENSNSSHTVLL